MTNESSVPLKELQKSPSNYEALFSSLQNDLTSEQGFYVRNHFEAPTIDQSTWRLDLELDGHTKCSFTYNDLRMMPKQTVGATLECAGNGRKHFARQVDGEVRWGDCAVSTAVWGGVPVANLIKQAGIGENDLNEIREMIFLGADGAWDDSVPLESKSKFVRSLPLWKAMDQQTLVALEMNGLPLSKNHGFPARIVVPGWYAMASVKWVTKIILSSSVSQFKGYFNWTKYVYETEDGPNPSKEPVRELRVKSLITFPEEGDSFPKDGSLVVSGKAWSGFGKVLRVEVDSGEGWREASLEEKNLGDYAWRSWQFEWTPRKSGAAVLRVRATDEKGNTQPELPQSNKYLYGYNAIHQVHVKIV